MLAYNANIMWYAAGDFVVNCCHMGYLKLGDGILLGAVDLENVFFSSCFTANSVLEVGFVVLVKQRSPIRLITSMETKT